MFNMQLSQIPTVYNESFPLLGLMSAYKPSGPSDWGLFRFK